MRTGYILLLMCAVLLAGILFLITLSPPGELMPLPTEELTPFDGDGNNWLI